MSILKDSVPERLLNAPPPSEAPLYTPDWWLRRREIDEWEQARRKAVLLVHLTKVEETFSPTEFGDPEPDRCIEIIPEYALHTKGNDILMGSKWCYLADAIEALERDLPVEGGPAPAEDEIESLAKDLLSEVGDLAHCIEGIRGAARALQRLARNTGATGPA